MFTIARRIRPSSSPSEYVAVFGNLPRGSSSPGCPQSSRKANLPVRSFTLMKRQRSGYAGFGRSARSVTHRLFGRFRTANLDTFSSPQIWPQQASPAGFHEGVRCAQDRSAINDDGGDRG